MPQYDLPPPSYSGYSPGSGGRAADLPPPGGGGPGYNAYYNSTIAPDQAWRQYNVDALNRDLGYTNQAYANNTGYLGRENALNQQNLGLSSAELASRQGTANQGFGLDRASLTNQSNYLQGAYGANSQESANQRDYLVRANELGNQMFQTERTGLENQWSHDADMQAFARQLFGIEGQSLQRNQYLAGQQYNLNNEQTGQALHGINDQAASATRKLMEEQVARGNLFSPGGRSDYGDILTQQRNQSAEAVLQGRQYHQNYAQQLGNLFGDWQKLGVNQAASENQYNYGQGQTTREIEKLGLQNQLRGLGYGRDIASLGNADQLRSLGYNRDMGQIGLDWQRTGVEQAGSNQLFDIASQRLGIDRGQLENNFNKAMFDLGINNAQDRDKIARSIFAEQAGGVDPYNNYAGTVGPYLYGGG